LEKAPLDFRKEKEEIKKKAGIEVMTKLLTGHMSNA
jgi:hypothetical protein